MCEQDQGVWFFLSTDQKEYLVIWLQHPYHQNSYEFQERTTRWRNLSDTRLTSMSYHHSLGFAPTTFTLETIATTCVDIAEVKTVSQRVFKSSH